MRTAHPSGTHSPPSATAPADRTACRIAEVFGAGDVHRLILSYFTPLQWILTLSRVNKTWRTLVIQSQALWTPVWEQVRIVVPALETWEIGGWPVGYRGYEWFRQVLVNGPRLHPMELTRTFKVQLGALHIHPELMDAQMLEVFSIKQEVHFYWPKHLDLTEKVDLSRNRHNMTHLWRPLRELVLRGEADFDRCSMLWGTTLHNAAFIAWLAERRQNTKKRSRG